MQTCMLATTIIFKYCIIYNFMFNIIPKIFTRNYRTVRLFSSLKKFGIEPETLPILPKINFPTRPSYQKEDQISKKDIYKYLDYKKKQFPRCRYMAFQHKGKLYHIFDASRYPLGRMCGIISNEIRGKNTPLYKNNIINQGATCIIVNGNNPLLTGKKLLFKDLKYHTGFVGNLRTYSYKQILLRKPQLLYHYIVKKMLPKNSLSVEYLKNLHVFRENTHDFKFLPQFAPDENIYEGLPQINLKDYILNNPDSKIVASIPGGDKKILGKQLPEVKQEENIQQNKQRKEIRIATSKKEIKRKLFQYKRHQYRYKIIRVKRKKEKIQQEGLEYFEDERKAKKLDIYPQLIDEDAPQQDEELLKQVFVYQNSNKGANSDKKQASSTQKSQSKPEQKKEQNKKGSSKQSSKKK